MKKTITTTVLLVLTFAAGCSTEDTPSPAPSTIHPTATLIPTPDVEPAPVEKHSDASMIEGLDPLPLGVEQSVFDDATTMVTAYSDVALGSPYFLDSDPSGGEVPNSLLGTWNERGVVFIGELENTISQLDLTDPEDAAAALTLAIIFQTSHGYDGTEQVSPPTCTGTELFSCVKTPPTYGNAQVRAKTDQNPDGLPELVFTYDGEVAIVHQDGSETAFSYKFEVTYNTEASGISNINNSVTIRG